MRIQGMPAIVVGGTSGIGRATALRLSRLGAKVAILDLPTSEGPAVAAELGGGSSFHACDVADTADVERAFEAAMTALGDLRIAVNAAGTDRRHPDAISFAPNLVGTFELNQLQAWRMSLNKPVDGERGVIINTTAFDRVARAGMTGMTRMMARGARRLGVRVTAIAPGRSEESALLAVAVVENQMLDEGTVRLDDGQRFAAS
jgi:NAD(P)-dependent dehydrogenase (short-subunit alcohol dehydrogenase family)